MPVVEIPGVGNVEFPDSMTGAQIQQAARNLTIKQRTPAQVEATMRQSIPQAFENVEGPKSWKEVAERLTINDIYGVPIQAVVDTAKALYNDFGGTVKAAFTPSAVEHVPKAIDAAKRGDVVDFLSHSANSVPIFGAIGETADINHPGRVVGNAALAAISSVPSGRALMGETGAAVRDVGRAAVNSPPVRAVVNSTPVAVVRGAARAGGPDLAKGGAKVAAGAAVDATGVPYHLGTAVGLREGWRDIVQGAKAAIEGGKDALAKKRLEALLKAAPEREAPAWTAFPEPSLDLPAEVEPIAGTLPSGRKPPSLLDIKRQEAMSRAAQADPSILPPPAPVEAPRFDPRTLPPDPIKSQPWYGDAVAAMKARRAGAPEAATPEFINPAVADESQVAMIRQMAQERTPNALADAFRNITPEMRRETIRAFDRDVITAAQDAVRKQLEAQGVTDPAIIESAVQAAKPDFAETVPTRIAAARANKASALFEVAKEAGITPAKMAKLTPAKWEELAIKAGVRKPTWTADGSATVREVIQMANEWEAKNGPITPPAKAPKPMKEPSVSPLNTPEKLAAAEELRKALTGEETPALPPYTERVGEHYRVLKPGEKVDGRVVRSSVPNMGSIEEDFTELPGIREIPMADIFEPGVPRKKGWSVAEERRYADLAEKIKQSGEVNPLIIGIDETGPYVIEGLARVNALHDLGAKSFPAVVVEDAASIAKRAKKK